MTLSTCLPARFAFLPRLAGLVLPLAVLAATGSAGCASLTFAPKIESIGTYRNTSATARKAEDLEQGSASEVEVVSGTLPDGMVLKEGMLHADPKRYRLLGKVVARYKNPVSVNFGVWSYDYKKGQRWRYGLCVWQLPLSWVTLTMWSWLSPTFYPCRVTMGDVDERRDAIVETLQRATKALGGNLVVVNGFGGLHFVTSSGAEVSSIEALQGAGLAFSVLGGASLPAGEGDEQDNGATPVQSL